MRLGDPPAGMLFQLMVLPAFAAEVARASQAALIVGDVVVEIALAGRPPARPEPAGLIPRGHHGGDPRRPPVRGPRHAVRAPAPPLGVLAALGAVGPRPLC